MRHEAVRVPKVSGDGALSVSDIAAPVAAPRSAVVGDNRFGGSGDGSNRDGDRGDHPAAPAVTEPPLAKHKYLIAFAVVLAALMQVIDSSIRQCSAARHDGESGRQSGRDSVGLNRIHPRVCDRDPTHRLARLVLWAQEILRGSIILFTLASFFCGASRSLGTLILWRIVQGMGGGALMTVSQAVLFVPLTTITLAELTHAELPHGTGLYNFFRQLGGSFGIAGIATLLTHYTAQFRATLGENVRIGDPVSMGRVNMLTHGFIARGADPFTAHQRALSILESSITGQASVIGYGRVYVLSAVLIVILIHFCCSFVRRSQHLAAVT